MLLKVIFLIKTNILGMKNNDIERFKKEGYENRVDFEGNRDELEEKFHVIFYKFRLE